MYDVRPNLIIGFHGCDEAVCQQLLNNPNEIRISTKPYDWLGNGFYLWENNIERAYEWAARKEKKGIIKKAAVIGAVVNLNHCCDLLNKKYITMLDEYYQTMTQDYLQSGTPLPQNSAPAGTLLQDKVLRKLDCAVMEYMHGSIYNTHKNNIAQHGYSTLKTFDSVRSAFIEGEPLYENAGFHHDTHIQICIRNPDCILGFFLPRYEIDIDGHLAQYHACATVVQW